MNPNSVRSILCIFYSSGSLTSLVAKNTMPVLTGNFVKHVFWKFCMLLIQFEGIPVCCGVSRQGEKISWSLDSVPAS